jgi:hypothetical protein
MQENKNISFAIFGSSQRCGSTLLQRIAAANASALCWGENGRVLNKFVYMQKELLKFADHDKKLAARYLDEKDHTLFIANMAPSDLYFVKDSFVNSARVLFESLYLRATPEPYRNIGLKEVGVDIEGIELFKDMFPSSKALLIARNPIDVWRSLHGWGSYTREHFFQNWKRHTLDYFNSSLPFIWYDDLVKGNLSAYLASTFELSVEEVNNMLKTKVGGTDKHVKDKAKEEDLEFIRGEYADVLREAGMKDSFVSILPDVC